MSALRTRMRGRRVMEESDDENMSGETSLRHLSAENEVETGITDKQSGRKSLTASKLSQNSFTEPPATPVSRRSLGPLSDVSNLQNIQTTLARRLSIKDLEPALEKIATPQPQETTETPATSTQPSHPVCEPVVTVEPEAEAEAEAVSAVSHATEAKPQQEPPVAVPRLVIRKLILTNFKSYAGQQIIGPFHSSFSAVVGPNGSGKSNVIDSLLFVFGFRASKMRQTKLSSLIHYSEAFPNLDFCSVDIFFQSVVDNEDGTVTEVPDSELLVSRKAFKNNSSKYYINGRESTYSLVTKLLKEKDIDLDHKRFLILQGEVESIAQMKPKAERENDDGLLEYLEDLIGTAQYKQPIEDSIIRVEELNDVCLEKENRFNIVDNELKALEDKKDAAVALLRQENNLAIKKSTYFQAERYRCRQKVETSEMLLKDLSTQLQAEEEKNRGSEVKMHELRSAYELHQKDYSVLAKHVDALKKKQKDAERRTIALDTKKRHLESGLAKTEKQLNAANVAKTQAENWIADYQRETAATEEKIAAFEAELATENAALEQIRVKLKGKTQPFTEKVEQYQKELEPWRNKIKDKTAQIAVTQSQLDLFRDQKSQREKQLEDAKSRVESIMKQGRSKERETLALAKELEHVKQQIALGTEECDHAGRKLDEMKVELANLRQKVTEAKAAIDTSQNQSKVLRGLTRLHEAGRIDGFYGRLGDLGTIDSKYDTAISTACPQLNNMVVQTVEVGQQCIEHLKKQNLGRAKFILLDKLPRRDMRPISTPQNVPRLFDLVQLQDEKFAPAFYSALGDTLVARDIEQAKAIAYGAKRWRVVTLDGKLIDKSGTLTGGGNSVQKGGMRSGPRSNVSASEMERMEKQLEEKEQKVAKADKAYEEMIAMLNNLKDRKPQLELQSSKVALEIESLAQALAESQKALQEAAKEAEQPDGDEASAAAVEETLQKLVAEVAELKTQTQEKEALIAELQEQILDAGGLELRNQKCKVDSIIERREILSEKLSSNVMTFTKTKNQLKKQLKTIETATEELSNIRAELSQLVTEYEKAGAELHAVQTELQEMEAKADAKQAEAEAAKEQLDEMVAAARELQSRKIELQAQISQQEELLAKERHAIQAIEHELHNLTLHNIAALTPWEKETAKEHNAKSDTDVDLEDVDANGEGDNDADMEVEMDVDEAPIQFAELSVDELAEINVKQLRREIESLETRIAETIVDYDVLAEYARRATEYRSRKNELNDAVHERDVVRRNADELRKRRLEEFMEGFNTISVYLKEMYQMITMGGNAELELVDSLDPFSEGILFSVMPPKKSWRNISNLSGGEKTLSSLALVFALHRYKPTPLYVMDEIDAALDFRNVSIVANYIKEKTKNAQFIVISLRNNMFELAQQLVGIYKVNNMTRSVALQNKEIIPSN